MKHSFSDLVRNEIRMLFNQFKSAVTTPSMLLFYGVTIAGIFFVSSVVSSLLSFAPLFVQFGALLESTIDRNMLFAGFGILSVSSVITGYFGLGPAAILTDEDENLLLPAPVKPHQIFLSRYVRRIVRKMAFALIGLASILPLLTSAHLFFFSTAMFILCFIIFLETNYFLGAMSSYIRLRIEHRTKSRFRYLILIVLSAIFLIPTYSFFTDNFVIAYILPSNAITLVFIEMTGIFSLGWGVLLGLVLQITLYFASLFVTANICTYDYYEVFSAAKGLDQIEGKFSRVIHGEVDFSNTRFNDPMIWIMLKDFYSRLRSPFQIWKYVYAVLGTAFVIYLNIISPTWFRPLSIPYNVAFAVVPAFILMMILLIQMSSITSMLSFVDEKENVYLLRVSPFRSRDVVLGKYLLSLFEITIAALPACGFLIYVLRIEGYLALVTLAAPLTILFTASGLAIGAYVPVLTNDPRTLPVPLAFSYPAINLSLGGLMVFLVSLFADSVYILVVLPAFCISLSILFLGLATRALETYK